MSSAYNGNEPYIFISYAHKDAHLVMPILQKMCESGFRIWYDKGIQGGFEWPEFIATKLFASSCVLAFISRSAIESKNCRREINFAIAKDKPLLAVYLEECELPLGMQMQLDTLQALFCTTTDEIDALIQKFQVTEVLQDARAKEAPVTEEQAPIILEEPAAEEQSPLTPEEPIEEEPAVTEEQPPFQPEEIPEPPAEEPEQEKQQAEENWWCSCGRTNPGKTGRCVCGNWRCVCGKVHASYVSSCSCGSNKRGEDTVQPVRYVPAPKTEQPRKPISWKCTCGRTNPEEKGKCECGNWRCTCGKIHAAYVSSCVCGNNKWKVALTQVPPKTERPRKPTDWECTCGRINPEEKGKCECGNWRCTCGKIHAAYMSSCICGNNKRKVVLAQLAYEAKEGKSEE